MSQIEQKSAGHRHGGHAVKVVAHIMLEAKKEGTQEFEIGSEATLLEVMHEAAELAGFELLPPRQKPFDELHSMNGEHVGAIIEHLDQTLAEYLHHAGHEPHFMVELVRTFRVNTRWDVAPKEEMTPREILALPRIHLNFEQYTLYKPESTEELPLDTPIKIKRGTDLEAQADGKYGGGH
jgi:hypothetical protein